MPTSGAEKKYFTRSNVLALLFVAAAGGFAWFGTRPGDSSPVIPPQTVTLAAPSSSLESAAETVSQPLVGTLPTRLVAQAAGIDTTVTEVGVVQEKGRASWETAWRSAGHHLNSARPGQPGNMVISGHVSVTDGNNLAVFANLHRLKAGDVIEVYSGSSVVRYTVQSTSTVQPTALQVLRSGYQSRITLITCTPDLKKRLVVVGTLT